WNELHGGNAADSLLRQMVLAIRMWKPDVVVTDCFDVAATGFPCEGLTGEAVREAFRRAADPKAFPEHANFLGLDPWQPSKIYSRWEGRADAEIKIALNGIRPELRVAAQESAGLLGDGSSLPAQRAYRHLGGVEGSQTHASLMHGACPQGSPLAMRPNVGRA